MSRFVIVHGAFEGAWCWEPIAERLRAAGHTVSAPDLPGAGDDDTPVADVTLAKYVESICAILNSAEEPAVLVGHSMGGIVITQAAADCADKVSQVVYVSAFLPKNGQSLQDLAALPEGQADGVQQNMVVEGDPAVATLNAEAGAEVLYGECDPETQQWAASMLAPQAARPFVEPVQIDDDAEVTRRFVFCTKDKAIPIELQRRMARESAVVETAEIATDHSPFFSAPDELTRILVDFAAK
ncbi:MAG TPA: alpha/beta fold hydrolase [Actinomycetaceae bacterium]|nr:alpha/beta fold hydrolase [Actinomycetaceae bacterium]